jgi:hypothetical protein
MVKTHCMFNNRAYPPLPGRAPLLWSHVSTYGQAPALLAACWPKIGSSPWSLGAFHGTYGLWIVPCASKLDNPLDFGRIPCNRRIPSERVFIPCVVLPPDHMLQQ